MYCIKNALKAILFAVFRKHFFFKLLRFIWMGQKIWKPLEDFSIDFSECLLTLVFSFVCSLVERPRAAPEPELQPEESSSSQEEIWGMGFTVGVSAEVWRSAFWDVLALCFLLLSNTELTQENLLIIKGYLQLNKHCSNNVRWMTWMFWKWEFKVTYLHVI